MPDTDKIIANCPACDNPNTQIIPISGQQHEVNCTECEKFYIGYIRHYRNILRLTEEEKIKFRYKLYRLDKNERSKDKNIINSQNKDEFFSKISIPTILDKIDNVLEHISEETNFFDQKITFKKNDYRFFFCKDRKELIAILNYLQKEGFILAKSSNDNQDIVTTVSPKGLKYTEESRKITKSDQCFVAMWFNNDESKGPNMDKVYSEAIEPAITNNKYEKCKIDNEEHLDWIPDKIIKEIRRSKFMIADLTGYRGGVYYEAGFAEGLGLKVIYTCNEDWFKDFIKKCKCQKCNENNDCEREGVHFDLRQKNMILWEEDKLPEFKEALINRIGGTIV